MPAETHPALEGVRGPADLAQQAAKGVGHTVTGRGGRGRWRARVTLQKGVTLAAMVTLPLRAPAAAPAPEAAAPKPAEDADLKGCRLVME